MPAYLKASSNGVLIQVHLQPRAKDSEIVGAHGDRLKIRVTAPPVDARANEALREFLSDKLQVSKNRVHIVAGKTSRKKTVLVEGLAVVWVEELLED